MNYVVSIPIFVSECTDEFVRGDGIVRWGQWDYGRGVRDGWRNHARIEPDEMVDVEEADRRTGGEVVDTRIMYPYEICLRMNKRTAIVKWHSDLWGNLSCALPCTKMPRKCDKVRYKVNHSTADEVENLNTVFLLYRKFTVSAMLALSFHFAQRPNYKWHSISHIERKRKKRKIIDTKIFQLHATERK